MLVSRGDPTLMARIGTPALNRDCGPYVALLTYAAALLALVVSAFWLHCH
jgi:hypothetical protein